MKHTTQIAPLRINIYGGREVNAAKFLAALYNRAAPQGLGMFRAMDPDVPETMTEEMARDIIEEQGEFRFDYLHGRPIKVFASRGFIDAGNAAVYDRDSGAGAFEECVEAAR